MTPETERILVDLAVVSDKIRTLDCGAFIDSGAAVLIERLALLADACPVKGTTMDQIMCFVSNLTHVSHADIISPSRLQPVVNARFLVCYLARHLTEMSYPAIGRQLGNRHHTTVIYGEEVVRERMLAEPRYAATVRRMEDALRPIKQVQSAAA